MRYTRQLTPYLEYNHMFCDPHKSSISYVVWLILVNRLLFWACFMRCLSKVLNSSDERFVLDICAMLSWGFFCTVVMPVGFSCYVHISESTLLSKSTIFVWCTSCFINLSHRWKLESYQFFMRQNSVFLKSLKISV